MKNRTTRLLTETALRRVGEGAYDPGTEVLVTEVFYGKGGMNYYTYGTEARGYWLRVAIETKHDSGARSFMMFSSGLKHFLEPAKAFSAKRLAALTVDPAVIERVTAAVMAKVAKEVA